MYNIFIYEKVFIKIIHLIIMITGSVGNCFFYYQIQYKYES